MNEYADQDGGPLVKELGEKLSDGQRVDELREPSSERFETGRNQACAATPKEASFAATLESIPQVIEFAKRYLEERGYSSKAQAKLAVIIDEIVSNVAKFAYGPSMGDVTIRLSTEQDGRVVEIAVIDEGAAFNPLDAPQVDSAAAVANRKIGGQGIFLVRSFADEVEYEREDGKNILRIRKCIER